MYTKIDFLCNKKFGGSRVYAKVCHCLGPWCWIFRYVFSFHCEKYTFLFLVSPAKIIVNAQMKNQYASLLALTFSNTLMYNIAASNGVYSEKFGGSRVYAKVRYGSGTVVLDIFLFIYSAAILF